MKAQPRSCFRLLSVTGAAFLLAFLVGAPREASARLYRPTDPPFPEGDPTADDQPSPTPKQGRYAIPVMPNSSGWAFKGGLIWLNTIRVWIRIAAR